MWKTRRHFLAASSALAISQFLYAQPAKSTSYADRNVVAAWVDKWAQSLKAVSEPLVLGRFADHMYYLYDKISWSPNSGQEELKPVNVAVARCRIMVMIGPMSTKSRPMRTEVSVRMALASVKRLVS